jgi:P27 family predicted phage terminase small subunit
MPKIGRTATPTALRVLRGNPRQHALPKREAKPRIPAGIPKPPSHLTREAKAYWPEIAEKLARVGLLTEIDGEALGAYCEARAIWVKAKKKLGEEGITITSPSGYTMPSPSFTVANKAFMTMYRMWVEFGMTPSSRTRIDVTSPLEEVDPFEQLLKSA